MGLALMDGSKLDSRSSASPSPSHRAMMLGSKILKKTFDLHREIQPEMLEQILNRVLAKGSVRGEPACDATADFCNSATRQLHDQPAKSKAPSKARCSL